MSTATKIGNQAALQQNLHPNPVRFPLPIKLGGRQYSFAIWQGEQLPDQLIAFDTETAAIQSNEVPQLAMATVCGDQGSCYFVHADALLQFILQHSQAYYVCHNASFDFWTTAQQLKADQSSLAAWWKIAADSRLICTMLLDCLIRLARIDADPINRDLATVASEYCPGLQLNKRDPYRLRYGELIGLPIQAWQDVEPGFWQYAAADPIATLQIALKQFQIAQQLIVPHGSELLPNALRRFGPLTCCLQVQGAIALDYVNRAGIRIDLNQAKQLHHAINALVDQNAEEMEQLLPGCFKRHGPRSKQAGKLQHTTAGVPRRNANLIKKRLGQIAKQSTEPIRPRRLKNGTCTDSVVYWAQHKHLDPFLHAYCTYSQQAKLAQFFRDLQADRIHPRYRVLVRTGRTSCSKPNLQQLPRDSRFREMITAAPGYQLLQIDYSVLELRTLAQICLKRYGRSRLAELFQQEIDPHKYTAALLLGVDLQQFAELPQAEQKQHRQRAKSINFGVPGGLGAASLVAYAKHSYGVQLDLKQAKDFRLRLIKQIYPELAAYLRDNPHQTIADNLQHSATLVRQALPKRDQILTAARIISGCDSTLGGDEYTQDLIDHVWLLLRQLNRHPELVDNLIAKQPSNTLMRRCFYGSSCTLSGRLRGHVNFNQAANSPFQGLAADGNKLALFRLVQAGFQVCGFIHDEMLILVPDGTNYDHAVRRVQEILIDSMQVLCPDIPISAEWLLADRWYKDAPEQPKDAACRIVPYKRNCCRIDPAGD